MSICWDEVHRQVSTKATNYANKFTEPEAHSIAFNGYFNGFMCSAGEVESLRKINERLRTEIEKLREVPTAVPETSQPEPLSDLADLI